MAERDTEPGDPVDPPSAGRTVEDEPAKFSFEVGLQVQKFEPEHLCVEGDREGAIELAVQRLPNESVRSGSLLRHRPKGPLEDAAFLTHQEAMVGRSHDAVDSGR